ncbi:cytoplasmic membrane protein [Mizugakiibacter sediminis]|uniref:Membrane protein n=1 Tax=Mizugakiibacter sediminis TaxID=1475481 RepID=A0A0K8QM44_9GAMM|nr:rhomboid family intramembrane serine protease [Mizugakiibacter sediminis]GAP65507.1 cytoplasmic membrane protein [Mizugakiibacter sediminis]
MSLTLLIIAATCAVSFLAFRNDALLQRLILWPPAIARQRQYYRLLSYGLVHADGQHLLFNMITLYFFGRAMEGLYMRYLGGPGYLLFYAGALVASILPTYAQNRENSGYRSLGASGAVSAVLFAFILVQPWATIFVFFFPLPAILYAVLYVGYSIYMDRRGTDSINHSAHLWGAAYGVAFTLAMEPRLLARFLDQLARPPF